MLNRTELMVEAATHGLGIGIVPERLANPTRRRRPLRPP